MARKRAESALDLNELQFWLEVRGLNQSQAARRAGMAPSQLTRWIEGQQPAYQSLMTFCAANRIPASAIFPAVDWGWADEDFLRVDTDWTQRYYFALLPHARSVLSVNHGVDSYLLGSFLAAYKAKDYLSRITPLTEIDHLAREQEENFQTLQQARLRLSYHHRIVAPRNALHRKLPKEAIRQAYSLMETHFSKGAVDLFLLDERRFANLEAKLTRLTGHAWVKIIVVDERVAFVRSETRVFLCCNPRRVARLIVDVEAAIQGELGLLKGKFATHQKIIRGECGDQAASYDALDYVGSLLSPRGKALIRR